MTRHNLFNYLLGTLALVMAIVTTVLVLSLASRMTHMDSAITHTVPTHSRQSWPDLTQEQIIALGEALKQKGTVVLYCASIECSSIRADFDDAFQIAEWDSSFESGPVESESDVGLFVGPPGTEADALIASIFKATGIKASPVDIPLNKGLGIIFGKRPK